MNLYRSRRFLACAATAAFFLGVPWAAAQGDHVNVPLTDPSRPSVVHASVLSGSITVKGTEGKEVIVEARSRSRERENAAEGNMKRVPLSSTGLSVEEENNQVDIRVSHFNQPVDLMITVPRHTSLTLRSVNGGDINVSDVDGELDVNNINGAVTLNHVGGTAVAHALNGRLVASFVRVDPQKPMAFSSLNGEIDVTFPADLKANVSLKSDRGDVYSDFDIQMQPTAPRATTEDNRGKGGKFVVRFDRTFHGTINGGGPEIQFKNFNGNIYIRKVGAAK